MNIAISQAEISIARCEKHMVCQSLMVSKMWCLGNEMDGEWQIGHKTAYEYGRLQQKLEDDEAHRSRHRTDCMWKFPVKYGRHIRCGIWEVLEQTYDVIDYLALHQYYAGQEKGNKIIFSSDT